MRLRGLKSYLLMQRSTLQVHEVFRLDAKGLSCHLKMIVEALIGHLLYEFALCAVLGHTFRQDSPEFAFEGFDLPLLLVDKEVEFLNQLVV
jgi:hypothetical protein